VNADSDLVAGAKAYVDSLVSHDPSAVPLHPECVRIEMGVKTGRSADHLRRSLARGPQYKVIHAVSDFAARVDGRTVHVTFYVHVQPKPVGLRSKVTESFVFDDDGQIIKILAKFGVPHR
jgi:hypothetical protein